MTDVGNADKMAAAGFPTKAASRIPQEVLPGVDATTRNALRPDGLLVSDMTQPLSHRKVHIVEIKYAADTDPSKQENHAQQQHDNLQHLLQSTGYMPQNIARDTIVLGVGGTIFTANLTTLLNLGVSQQAAERTLAKVHITSVKWLHKIYTFKLMQSKHQAAKTGMG